MNPGLGIPTLEPQLPRGKMEEVKDQGLESQEERTWSFSRLALPMALVPHVTGTLWTFSFLVYLSSSYQQ